MVKNPQIVCLRRGTWLRSFAKCMKVLTTKTEKIKIKCKVVPEEILKAIKELKEEFSNLLTETMKTKILIARC